MHFSFVREKKVGMEGEGTLFVCRKLLYVERVVNFQKNSLSIKNLQNIVFS